MANPAQEIDRICDQFEQAWLQDKKPHISEFVKSENVAEFRNELLAELLKLDIEYRTRAGDTINVDLYADQFPEKRVELLPILNRLINSETVVAFDTSVPRGFSAPDVFDATNIELGQYELLHEIARGAMGVVYKARQKSTHRIVALKMMLAGQFANNEEIARFHYEAKAAAKLDHPNIVPVYDAGEQQGYQYLAMGFVDGQTLAQYCEANPIPIEKICEIVGKLSAAIQVAHDHGIVHRDLKPANVMMTKDGEPKVTDFGLAKFVEGGSEMTKTGQVVGTPSYMSPEQATSRLDQIGPLSDVYSLGAVFYGLLVGRPPFLAGSVYETIAQVAELPPVPPRSLNAAIPRDVETICLKCLEKDPKRRYPSAQALADELDRFKNNMPIHARPVPVWTRAMQWCKRKPAVASLLALITITLVSGFAVSMYFAVLADRRAERAEEGFRTATERSELAFKTLQTVVYTVQERLKKIPQARELRRELLIDVLGDLEEFSSGYIEQASIDRDSAKVLTDLAKLYLEIGDEFGSGVADLYVKHHRKAVDIYLQLVNESPTDQELLGIAFDSILEYGNNSREFRKFQEAITAHTYGREVASRWYELAPDDPNAQLAFLKSSEALGEALTRSRRPEEARDYCIEAVRLAEEYCSAYPSAVAFDNLCRCYSTEGDMYRDLKEFDNAATSYFNMTEATKKTIELDPGNPANLDIQSSDYERLGGLEEDRKNYTKAREYYEKMLEFSERYMADDPTNLMRMQQSTWAYKKLGDLCALQGDTERAAWCKEKLEAIQSKLAGERNAD